MTKTKPTLRDHLRTAVSFTLFEIRIWFYAIRHVPFAGWLPYRHEVRRIENEVREALEKLLIEQHVIPMDATGIDLVADRIADVLRRNLPD